MYDMPPTVQAEVLRVELRLASAAFEGREAVASAEFEALTRKCEAAEGRAEKASDAARTAAAERDAESKAGSRAQSEAEEAKAAATRAVESARRAEATEFDLQVRIGMYASVLSSVVLQPCHISPFFLHLKLSFRVPTFFSPVRRRHNATRSLPQRRRQRPAHVRRSGS